MLRIECVILIGAQPLLVREQGWQSRHQLPLSHLEKQTFYASHASRIKIGRRGPTKILAIRQARQARQYGVTCANGVLSLTNTCISTRISMDTTRLGIKLLIS